MLGLVALTLGCARTDQAEVRAKVAGSYRLVLPEEVASVVPEGATPPDFRLDLKQDGTFELRSQRMGVPDEVASGAYTVLGARITVAITRVDGHPAVGPERETLLFDAVPPYESLKQGDGSVWKRIGS